MLNVFYPFERFRKKHLLENSTANFKFNYDKDCPAARGEAGCLHSNYFYFARLNQFMLLINKKLYGWIACLLQKLYPFKLSKPP